MLVSFVRLRDLNDFKDGRFCFATSFQGWLVKFSYKISVTSGLFGHEISMIASLVPLRDLNDDRFWWVTRFQ